MSRPVIPEYTDTEIATIRELLAQCYRKDVEIHLADSEILLTPDDDTPVTRPTVFWHEREANFVVIKTSVCSYRTQFFYTPHDQHGTGIDEYNDLKKCVTAVLRTQSDNEKNRSDNSSGVTGETKS